MGDEKVLSDSELDEAVARECMGWPSPPGHRLKEGIRDVPVRDTRCGELVWFAREGPLPDTWFIFRPATDARDAERVWDWLLERSDIGVEVWRSKRPSFYNLEKPDSVSIDPGHDEEPFLYADGWKRAVCLAALTVARGGKP